MIYNADSEHTLLSNYQMCECGFVVDDVYERHPNTHYEHGTYSI